MSSFCVINAINSIDEHSLREVECEIYGYWIQWTTWRKGLEIYSANLGVNVGARLTFLVVTTCGDFYYNWKGVNKSAFPTHLYLS